jgi:CheY-like chemotaxis protein
MGSRFSFELELVQDQQAASGTRTGYSSLGGISIGWIDSSKQRADWYGELLQRWQANVTTATSVVQAAALLSQAHFEILFIDDEILLDEARTLVSAYRSRNPGSALVVLCRAYEKNAMRKHEMSLVEELAAGGEACMRLIKPVTPTELHDALQRALLKNHSLTGQPPPAGDNAKKSLRILLAEDNYVNQVLAVSVLEKLQHVVDIASDGQQALGKLEKNHYDLVLMDVQMPHMGGLEVTHIWRERERERGQKRLPIIAMTAHAMRGDQERCLQAGMDGYVSKPFQQMTLHTEIERVICGEVRTPIYSIGVAEPRVFGGEFSAAHALAMLQNDDRLLTRIAKVFLQAAPGVRARLQQAAEHQDAELLRRAAHEVKGMAYNLGAVALGQIAASMEKLAKEHKVQQAMYDHDRLMSLFDNVALVMREVASGSTKADR